MVRAAEDSDSDKTDAGQAEVSWKTMESSEPHPYSGLSQSALDYRALVSLGISDDYPLWNRAQDVEKLQNSKGSSGTEKDHKLQAMSDTEGLTESGNVTGDGLATGKTDSIELRQGDVYRRKDQVKKKRERGAPL